MNLIDDKWVPVLGSDGHRRLVSLRGLFAEAGGIRDLAAPPHEKIALMRLLICLTQAALDGPEDRYAWENCREEIQPRVAAYLEKWRGSFELFGDGVRFLQLPGLKPGKEDGEGTPATKLDLALASGNNSSLFDNAAAKRRPVTQGRLALTLVSYQAMAPCSIVGEARWESTLLPKCTAKHAPGAAGSMLHTYLQGGVLVETIHLNLLTKEAIGDLPNSGWGQPVWELAVTGPGDKAAIANATNTYLGRLVPLPRAIRLEPDDRTLLLANGLDYPLYPIFRETAATVVRTKDDELKIMGVSLGRSLWRQLGAITIKRRGDKEPVNGPAALGNLAEDQSATLWIGALATDKAKIEDVVEASYDIPAGMFRDDGRKLYEAGVDHADQWSRALGDSVKSYAVTLKLEPPPSDRARQHFWTLIEHHVSVLLALAGDPDNAGDLATSAWGTHVRRAAYAAYQFACPHQSPRQIEAFEIGRQRLHLPKPADPNKPARKTKKLQPA